MSDDSNTSDTGEELESPSNDAPSQRGRGCLFVFIGLIAALVIFVLGFVAGAWVPFTTIREDARSNLKLARSFLANDQIEHAKEKYIRALALYESVRSDTGLARVYRGLGLVYSGECNPLMAEEYFLKSLELDEKTSNTENVALTHVSLAGVYKKMGDLVKAEEYCLLALKYHDSAPLDLNHAFALCALGEISSKRGDTARSKIHYLKAADIVKSLGNAEYQGAILHVLAAQCRDAHEFDEAEEYYLEALRLLDECGLTQGVGTITLNLGNLAKGRGELEVARQYWERAVHAYETEGNPGEAQKIRALIQGGTETNF